MNCLEAREEFSALLDGELDPESRSIVEAHLAECSDCLRELGQLKQVDGLYRELTLVSAPPDFESRINSEVRPKSARIQFERTRLRARPLWPTLAMAALLLVLFGGFMYRLQTTRPADMNLAKVAPESQATSTSEADQMPTVVFEAPKLAEQPPAAAASPAPPPVEAPSLQRAVPEKLSSAEPNASAMPTKEQPAFMMGGQRNEAKHAAGLVRSQEAESLRDESAVPAQKEIIREEAAPFRAVSALKEKKEEMHFAPKPEPLQQSAAEADAAKPARKIVAEIEFEFRDGVWQQIGYTGQAVTVVRRSTDAFARLQMEQKNLADIAALGDRVVFRLGDVWYRIEPTQQ